MVIYARNDLILCRIFPSSLKGVASNWFYSLPSRSSHKFKDLIKLFISQYFSRQELKQNNHYLLCTKMKPSDSLKAYVGHFQSQRTKVYNCSDDASALAFISRLWVTTRTNRCTNI